MQVYKIPMFTVADLVQAFFAHSGVASITNSDSKIPTNILMHATLLHILMM